MSQSELARRVGLRQSTINGLIRGEQRSSTHLHKIARVLQTTPAHLEGETDDPDAGAPTPLPAPAIQFVALQVALPSEAVLAQMFEGLLDAVDRSAPTDALALELAQLMPTALSQLQGRLIEAVSRLPLPAEVAAVHATFDREQRR